MAKLQVGMVRVIVGDTIVTRSLLMIYPVEVNQPVNWSTYTTVENGENVAKNTCEKFLAQLWFSDKNWFILKISLKYDDLI